MKAYPTNHKLCRTLGGRFVFPFIVIAFSSFFFRQAYAQTDSVAVPSDIPPHEGNLNIAIQNAIDAGTLSNTVFHLEPNGYYVLTKTITVPAGEHLTIVAPEPGGTQETALPQIVWSSSEQMWDPPYHFKYQYNFDCYGDITLKNIWLYYATTNGDKIQSSLVIQDNPAANESGKGEFGIFEGVIFYYAGIGAEASGSVSVKAKHFKRNTQNIPGCRTDAAMPGLN